MVLLLTISKVTTDRLGTVTMPRKLLPSASAVSEMVDSGTTVPLKFCRPVMVTIFLKLIG